MTRKIDIEDEGVDFALIQLCKVLGVDPKSVCWDAATETRDGDVRAVISNILALKGLIDKKTGEFACIGEDGGDQ